MIYAVSSLESCFDRGCPENLRLLVHASHIYALVGADFPILAAHTAHIINVSDGMRYHNYLTTPSVHSHHVTRFVVMFGSANTYDRRSVSGRLHTYIYIYIARDSHILFDVQFIRK